MGDSVECLTEVKIDNIHCSPFVNPASYAIIEGYHVGQARSSLGESMLTVSDNLLVLCMPGDDLQAGLLYHLSRDGGELGLFSPKNDGEDKTLPLSTMT